MAQTSASPEPDLSDQGTVWDDQIAGEAFAGFDVPRRRITGRADAPTGRADAPTGRADAPAGRADAPRQPRQVRRPATSELTAGSPRPAPSAEPEASRRAPHSPATQTPGSGVPGRRTVTIRGYGSERNPPLASGQSRHRRAEPRHQRPGFKADRMALWAVLLGIVLVVVAAASAHGAVIAHVVHHAVH